jgi:GNAT superfamily N-acetyltransferase
VGRGPQLVDADLLAALADGQIGDAVLDVTDPEPLPPAHAFWRYPRVQLTPHIASMTQPSSAAHVVLDNLARFEAGEPMLDVRCEDDAGEGQEGEAIRAVAVSRMGTALGSAHGVLRAGSIRIGRMTLLPALRGTGIGPALVDALAAAAKQRGATEAVLEEPIDDAELPGAALRRAL